MGTQAAKVMKMSYDNNSKRARLQEIIAEKSYIQDGDFKLASGASSSFFFDMKMTLLDPEGASLAANLILDMIKGQNVKAVAGLELGACPIVSAVCVKSLERSEQITGIYVRKTPKKRGTQKMIEGLELKAGDRVVVVDDVTTAGGSVLQAVEQIKELGCEIVSVISIVDRLQGARERIEGAGYIFEPLFTKDDFAS